MGDKTAIQWADATWNPTTGCDRVSPGCARCYAATLAPRLQAMSIANGVTDPTAPYMKDGDPKTSGVGFGFQMHPDRLDQPLRWKRPRRIFVNSMSDLFHEDITESFLDAVFAVMALAPQHTFQVLTKRPERMREYMATGPRKRVVAAIEAMKDGSTDEKKAYRAMVERSVNEGVAPKWPLSNVWLGTSVENARWRTRIDELRATPAAIRFLSCEPLLGPLADPNEKWTQSQAETGRLAPLDLTGIDWLIIGGESGSGARAIDEQWVRDILASCRRQLVAPFVKQMGLQWSIDRLGKKGHAGDITEWPEDLRVREFPKSLVGQQVLPI